tara:strand:+ start:2154 stop:3311 length:1158 start_codon:yes stop_codon:yes gene_type:complete
MVFDGTRESCPNYNPDTDDLDMSYRAFINPFGGAPQDEQYGKEDFNLTCFNICATKNEDDSDKGPTYIMNSICNSCLDEEGEENNPDVGTRNYLINAGLYEMCNVNDDNESGFQEPGVAGVPTWFQKQQDANLLGLSVDPDNKDLFEIETPSMISLNSFSDMLSGLQYDSAFESCVNDKLHTPGDNDLEIQNRIADYTSIKEFTNVDISYLKRKLRKIITMKSHHVNECMNLLNLGKSICQTGVADKTLMIGSLIFSIVGNDKIDIIQADNDERYKINKLVDELGPLVPQAVKNIIKISKEYETRVCNVPSNTTLLLERLYTDLYDKPTHITLDFSPYLDFNSLINMNNVKFIKTIVVLVVFAFLFMHATNLVIAFLSRGGSKSD